MGAGIIQVKGEGERGKHVKLYMQRIEVERMEVNIPFGVSRFVSTLGLSVQHLVSSHTALLSRNLSVH